MARNKDPGSRYAAKKGRSATDRFARLSHTLLCKPAYRALSPNARSLLVEFAMMENGRNNGNGLFLSVRDAAARMGVSDVKAARRAMHELQELGFIAMTADAHFAVKASDGSRARYWRITWQAVNGVQGPTNEFFEAEPAPKTAGRRRMDRGLRALKRWKKQNTVEESATQRRESVVESATAGPPPWINPATNVEESATQNPMNGRKPPIVVVGVSSTYTADQSGEESRTGNRNPNDSTPKIPGGDFRGGETDASAPRRSAA